VVQAAGLGVDRVLQEAVHHLLHAGRVSVLRWRQERSHRRSAALGISCVRGRLCWGPVT
jgi:hypothetical protein